jgi:hypothetical protein
VCDYRSNGWRHESSRAARTGEALAQQRGRRDAGEADLAAHAAALPPAGEHVEQRRLARARRAHQRRELARREEPADLVPSRGCAAQANAASGVRKIGVRGDVESRTNEQTSGVSDDSRDDSTTRIE